MEAANWAVTLYETTGIVTASEIASRIREAAERHYGPIINEMKEQLTSLHQALNHQTSTVVDMTKERDAALAEVERLKAESPSPIDLEKFRKHLHETYSGGHHHDGHYEAFHHGMDTVCNVLEHHYLVYFRPNSNSAPQPAPPSPAAAATGDLIESVEAGIDGWVKRVYFHQCRESVLEKIRPLFDAVRAELDEAKRLFGEQCELNVATCDSRNKEKQRAEAAEAERDKWFKQHDALEDKWNSFYRRVGGYLSRLKKSFGITGDLSDEAIVDAAIAERDKLAAELGEVRDMVTWAALTPISLTYDHANGRVEIRVMGMLQGVDGDTFTAIREAWQKARGYRATKGKEQADA